MFSEGWGVWAPSGDLHCSDLVQCGEAGVEVVADSQFGVENAVIGPRRRLVGHLCG